MQYVGGGITALYPRPRAEVTDILICVKIVSEAREHRLSPATNMSDHKPPSDLISPLRENFRKGFHCKDPDPTYQEEAVACGILSLSGTGFGPCLKMSANPQDFLLPDFYTQLYS